MVVGITRQDLQEEFQTLSNTVQLELRVEFLKLNKRLEGLERLLAASKSSRTLNPSDQSLSDGRRTPSTQGRTPSMNETTSASTNVEVIRVSKRNSRNRKHLETPELTDHYFRTFATGAEKRQWEEEESMNARDSTSSRKSSRRFLHSMRNNAAVEDGDTVNAFMEIGSYPRTGKGAIKSPIRAKAKDIVSRPLFNAVIGAFIFLNAVTLGVQTDHMATKKLKEVPTAFKIIELTFCLVFTLEILLKLIAHRSAYFTATGWKWNAFDFFLVAMTILDILLDELVKVSFSNFSAIRVLRVLRVVRIIRVIRLLRMIGELRAIVASVLGSLRSLCWTVLLLLAIIYVIGIYFTQLLIEERISAEKDFPVYASLYGSIPRSILTLYESISGGIDWDDAVAPLINDISPFYGVVFGLYIAFTVLAIMNVVTGVFVESALQSAREDKHIYIVNHVRELIEQMMEEGDGIISWERFQGKLETKEMREVFKHIDVDMKEAPGLFKLLDLNDNGEVDPEEFLDGILKFGGTAKALDVALMMREIKRLTFKVQQCVGLWATCSIYEPEPQAPLRHTAKTPSPPPVQDLRRLKSSILSEVEHYESELS